MEDTPSSVHTERELRNDVQMQFFQAKILDDALRNVCLDDPRRVYVDMRRIPCVLFERLLGVYLNREMLSSIGPKDVICS